MKTRHLFAAALAASLGLNSAFAGGEGWTQDFETAKKQAAEEKKDLLIDFTGSDWCPPCKALTAQVLSKEEFRTLTKDKFVLVELDFPRQEENVKKQSDADRERNQKLLEQYGVEGFPTLILTDAGGKPYAYTGFQPGGPEEYVKHLDELRTKGETMKGSLEKAEKSEGVEKAKALVSALGDLPDMAVTNFYPTVVSQIKEADPKDETGYAKKLSEKAQMAEFEAGLQEFGAKQDMEGALGHVDKALESGKFSGENKQKALLMKVSILANMGKFDDSLKFLEEAKAAAPDSEIAGQLDGFKAQLEQAKAGAAGGAEKAPKEEEKEETEK
ncbi:thioredoxin family protein [Luteolibacter sp. GHJ8]|uniref:Thioredoxin family protein n=1 Tax=Luteolibacter rhizosphaerae TaxID=2989719 RepID=A0ABT3G0R4_9BACT|nr:thioredoxin family protein [Luteolibacter rhizosphaerae]MCW1913432.1 thioredoxin family protein [Luteolibacter rhizosphaerae]